MFGIGLPEFILIMALALIVVGPDKLPDLARSVAKGILELKKTANTLKENLTADGNPLDDIKPELEEAARSLKNQVLDVNSQTWRDKESVKLSDPSKLSEATSSIIDIDAEEEAYSVQKKETEAVLAEKEEKDPHLAEIPKKSNAAEQQS
ncbi:MAG: twin-arginine translocase TatA/TatE family subunit [Proteobacteria bacterium]|nr:twin-arginine translocase TatA/TatE family subunit [Pseudomonadota bacterium]MBU1231819.1 twin-arginine translocase TatA/TatE family subunit [Pseudomonadota bacterium]MBU1419986.1 twin-arginine translocase TatA/TatE family subunit [Pseudomonadota bacterium]MBU1454769.1 twin-arginine translocase TatA/TatE family subunit [Pseudomonadota bacterium]